jgi:FkbM family methyltransferase
MSQAVKAEAWRQRKTETKDRILAASRSLRKEGSLEQWETPKGVFWTPYESRYGLPFHLAEQEMNIYGTAGFAVRAGDIVLDCGANIGTFTRKAIDLGARKVIAIEPAPENLECLRRNFAKEVASGQVVIYPKGVWHEDATLTLHLHHDNSAADSFLIKDGKRPDEDTVQAPLTTIDKMVAELGLDRVDFIKMDIEGAEPNALRGARGTLAKFHPRLAMSVYHEANHPEVVPQLIREAWPGYRMECGPCAVVGNRIRPDIMYFQ